MTDPKWVDETFKYGGRSATQTPDHQLRLQRQPTIKVEAGPEEVYHYIPSHSFAEGSQPRRSPSHCPTEYSDNDAATMADGRNEARAIRILEIMNDFRTLQHHIESLVNRSSARAPDQDSYYFDGYVVLRQCQAESQAILATHFNPGIVGLQTDHVPQTEVHKATLQRIILDASTRRMQAHKIYLRAAAAMRWVQMRQQVLKGAKPNGRHANDLRRIDHHLRQELSSITDDHVVGDLRAADRRKGYWVEEDPSLDRMLSWIRSQR